MAGLARRWLAYVTAQFEVSEDLLAQLPADEFPHMTRMIVDYALEAGYDFSAEFEWGLDLILDGIERALHRSGSSQTG